MSPALEALLQLLAEIAVEDFIAEVEDGNAEPANQVAEDAA